MAEWSNAHAWKACKSAMASGVRIPLLPPESYRLSADCFMLNARLRSPPCDALIRHSDLLPRGAGHYDFLRSKGRLSL